jgi:transcriptional regulator with XRE-family HTH domain
MAPVAVRYDEPMQTHHTPSPAPKLAPHRKATLRVHVLMAEHDIRFVTELWKRLTAMGVDISHSQLTRVVNNSTKSLSIDLLEGLATLFDCPVSSLFKDN